MRPSNFFYMFLIYDIWLTKEDPTNRKIATLAIFHVEKTCQSSTISKFFPRKAETGHLLHAREIGKRFSSSSTYGTRARRIFTEKIHLGRRQNLMSAENAEGAEKEENDKHLLDLFYGQDEV